MKRIVFYTLMLVAFSNNITAQNFRFKPLVGGTNTISKFTRLPKIDEHENILFSMLLANGWTGEPEWIYATDSTELLYRADYKYLYDTNTHRLKIEKADMDSLRTLVRLAILTTSYFDAKDYCTSSDDTIYLCECLDCPSLVLMYNYRWAMAEGACNDGVGSRCDGPVRPFFCVFKRVKEAIRKGDIFLFKSELPHIYKLSAIFRSYFPKSDIKLWW